jgi:hypothetical protein
MARWSRCGRLQSAVRLFRARLIVLAKLERVLVALHFAMRTVTALDCLKRLIQTTVISWLLVDAITL